jgi:hypothetical protein
MPFNVDQELVWNDVAGAAEYRISARDGSNQPYGALVVQDAADTTCRIGDVITDAPASDTYTFSVVARDGSGQDSSPATVQDSLGTPSTPTLLRIE